MERDRGALFEKEFHLLAVSTSSWPEAHQVHLCAHTATTTSTVIDVRVIVVSEMNK